MWCRLLLGAWDDRYRRRAWLGCAFWLILVSQKWILRLLEKELEGYLLSLCRICLHDGGASCAWNVDKPRDGVECFLFVGGIVVVFKLVQVISLRFFHLSHQLFRLVVKDPGDCGRDHELKDGKVHLPHVEESLINSRVFGVNSGQEARYNMENQELYWHEDQDERAPADDKLRLFRQRLALPFKTGNAPLDYENEVLRYYFHDIEVHEHLDHLLG